ncbi:MAG: N-acetylmuramoyl-L-alanine amidase-like domain-containing protein, partial [Syntrophales bacterium]
MDDHAVQTNRQGLRSGRKDKADAVFLPEDLNICEALLGAAGKRSDKESNLPELAVSLGRRFIGAPYQSQTLESAGTETLVANLRAFDCMTFVESVIALALSLKSGKTKFADYLLTLKKLRYRNGWIDGYQSRLHYF